jgi:GT2 family glycosyltransferase
MVCEARVTTLDRAALPVRDGERPEARGKFLWVGDRKLYVKGVTYGTFRPDELGREFHDPVRIDRDFEAMSANGINTVRTYTVPPLWLLDLAQEHGLRVLAGLPWEQHITFLDDRRRVRSILERARESVRSLAGHAALLAVSIGNEIPAPIVRWHGRERTERFLEQMYRTAKDADPEALVTYVSFPSTEYLELPFLDVYAFNVFLESRRKLEPYLARLQNIAGDRPLLLSELGLDSRRNGLDGQAASLDWQLRAAFAAGAAGTFVYSWTDEWHRGGHDIDDWDFGLTDRDRRPKPALESVRNAYRDVPFPQREWPAVTVVVCSHNGAATIGETCAQLQRLDYPDVQVIVVDDGSTDLTAELARAHGFEVISTPNQGLSAARNEGLHAARGEYIAYLDDDAWPDPQWLQYLVHGFERNPNAAVGGPNIPPPDDGATAACVALAPGGPIHVLVSDDEAEHIPGCNMAFRTEVLRAMGGFDPVFRAAGDDVDLCWRLSESGLRIGFSPAAMVWHRRRATARAYLRQQRGYGRAEALLERKWPQKYNGLGHVTWSGHLYGSGRRRLLGRRSRIYFGMWGSGLFQRIYQPPPTSLHALPLLPEWPLVLAVFGALAALGAAWSPLYFALIPAALLGVFVVLEAGLSALHASSPGRRRLLLAALFLLQPIARLGGRLSSGLTPWRIRGRRQWAVPLPRNRSVWSEDWADGTERLARLEAGIAAEGTPVVPGGGFDRWDLEARGGMLGAARLLMTVEEHGAGRQLLRFRIRPRATAWTGGVVALAAGVSVLAALSGAVAAAAAVGVIGGLIVLRSLAEISISTRALLRAVETPGERELTLDLERRLHTRAESAWRSG